MTKKYCQGETDRKRNFFTVFFFYFCPFWAYRNACKVSVLFVGVYWCLCGCFCIELCALPQVGWTLCWIVLQKIRPLLYVQWSMSSTIQRWNTTGVTRGVWMSVVSTGTFRYLHDAGTNDLYWVHVCLTLTLYNMSCFVLHDCIIMTVSVIFCFLICTHKCCIVIVSIPPFF